MADDAWSEAWSQLTTALEKAWAAGMTYTEILDLVDETCPDYDEAISVDLQPKKKKTTE